MPLSIFPLLNACLNATSAILLISGAILIKRGAKKAHAALMMAALSVSILFLISYVYYHFHHGATPFPHEGRIRTLYFTILISHTSLAATVPPLAVLTLLPALKQRFKKHVTFARVTFPIWLYVSVTGVVIYWMLHRI